MSYQTDEDIIKGCLLGKREAQLALYHSYGSRLFGICLRYLPNKQDAEDAFQDAFVKIFTGMKAFEHRSDHSLFAWMKKIMSNTCLNLLRDTKRYRLTLDLDENSDIEILDNSEITVNSMLENISGDEIMEIIQELPDGYRTIFNLYVLDGLTHIEISELLNISVSTSKTQLMKARRTIALKITQKTLKNKKIHSFNYIYK